MKKILMIFLLGLFSANAEETILLSQIDIEIEQSELLESCPANLYKPPQQKFVGDYVFCENNPKVCFEACKKSDANKCFSLGYSLQQKEELDSKYAEFLFAKACQQGLPLGCTNRAAHLYRFPKPGKKSCVLKSFKKTCDLNDGWGCTMYGMRLVEGDQKNLPLAIEILKKTCDIEPNNRSCAAAKKLMKRIETIEEH